MSHTPVFDLISAPLQGSNCIEASAGTGKTFTIAGLYLRLLLEKEFTVDQILVVTFTKAATAELRDRIRRKIKDCLHVFQAGTDKKDTDPLLFALKERFNKFESQARLKLALQDFDRAAIFTIHGFCQRTLGMYAFESGMQFGIEILNDENLLVAQICGDFWRKFILVRQGIEGELLTRSLSLHNLSDLAQEILRFPDLQIKPLSAPAYDLLAPAKIYEDFFEKLAGSYSQSRPELEKILKNKDTFKQNIYKPEKIDKLFVDLEDFLTQNDFKELLKESSLDLLHLEKLEKSLKKAVSLPEHDFFYLFADVLRAAQDLKIELEKCLLSAKREFMDYLQTELDQRKQIKSQLGYSDLLTRLRQGLKNPDLVQTLRTEYQAALIDEFQDTDPIQYQIFSRLFAGSSHILFLIGDPKQAIYSFRGADVFTYMQAAANTRQVYTLPQNWRSTPQMIEAVNSIFSARANPFIYQQIPFNPVRPGSQKTAELIGQGKQRPALTIWLHSDDSRVSRKDFEAASAKATAAEITRLIQEDRNFLGTEKILPKDIAVLVRTNREGEDIKNLLEQVKVPCVLSAQQSIFLSAQAKELLILLEAILDFTRQPVVRTALATDLLGVKAEGFELFERDEALFEVWLQKFAEYNELWAKYGFMPCLNFVLGNEDIRSRLLSLPSGERKLTNTLHLIELLHAREQEDHLGMSGLVSWLSKNIKDAGNQDEYQLRLESDAQAVRIVTIHKSKGLEYPIVFCPFVHAYSKPQDKNQYVVVQEQDLKVIDLGTERQEARKAAKRVEDLAENLRVLYVALTRAKSKCYVGWGWISSSGTSALSWLVHNLGQETSPDLQLMESIWQARKKEDGPDIKKDWKRIVKTCSAINLEDMPESESMLYTSPYSALQDLDCKKFSREFGICNSLNSFSSLVRGMAHTRAELMDEQALANDFSKQDLDDLSQGKSSQAEHLTMFDFEKGARAGTCLHSVFENLGLSPEPKQIGPTILQTLETYGFEDKWQRAVQDMFESTVNKDLQGMTLKSVESPIFEMEFYFPLQKIKNTDLQNLYNRLQGFLSGTVPEQIGRLNFSPRQGFMTGFMDLVFKYKEKYFILDWKSNYLGNKSEDYDRHNMLRAMTDNFYFLQYHIYSLALHLHLKASLPDYAYQRHFGGVYYIFLRGVCEQENTGIFMDRPQVEFIEELQEVLVG